MPSHGGSGIGLQLWALLDKSARKNYYPHLTDEEAEAQRSSTTSPRPHRE